MDSASRNFSVKAAVKRLAQNFLVWTPISLLQRPLLYSVAQYSRQWNVPEVNSAWSWKH